MKEPDNMRLEMTPGLRVQTDAPIEMTVACIVKEFTESQA